MQLEIPPTNNSIEGQYMSFQGSISVCNSTISKFSDLLK